MSINVQITLNLDDNAIAQLGDKMREGLQEWGEIALKASQDVCPVRTGRLRDSAALDVSGDKIELSYNTDYALVVHEGTSTRPPNRYLTDPVNQLLKELPIIIESKIE